MYFQIQEADHCALKKSGLVDTTCPQHSNRQMAGDLWLSLLGSRNSPTLPLARNSLPFQLHMITTGEPSPSLGRTRNHTFVWESRLWPVHLSLHRGCLLPCASHPGPLCLQPWLPPSARAVLRRQPEGCWRDQSPGLRAAQDSVSPESGVLPAQVQFLPSLYFNHLSFPRSTLSCKTLFTCIFPLYLFPVSIF